MARITTIAVGFFLVATVTSAVLLLTGRTADVDESAIYFSIIQAAAHHAPASATARHAKVPAAARRQAD